MDTEIVTLTPDMPDFTEAVEQVAGLRITVFREWPYLYEGTLDYERGYISRLAMAEGAVIIAAREGAKIVGVSTGMPLLSEHEELIAPFRGSSWLPEEIFYGAETVMLPAWRGRGIYRRFLEHRRLHARKLGGFRWEVFCGVLRAPEHPLFDPAIPPLDPVWEHFGYRKLEGVVTGFSWQDVGMEQETEKPMQFWLRAL